MALYIRALILILIFSGSIFCKVWIYSQSQVQFKRAHTTISQKEGVVRCTLNRLFKSRRRLEDLGFAQKAMSPLSPELFYPTITIFRAATQIKPPATEVYSLPQPPRIFSLI
jgi:hypothetical protein